MIASAWNKLLRLRVLPSISYGNILSILLFLAGLNPALSQAASSSWIIDANGTWINTANWLSGIVPGSTTTDNLDVATFSLALTAARTVTVDSTRYIGGISFGNISAFGYTLSGGSVNLNNGGVIQTLSTDGAHTETISSAIKIDGGSGSTATFTAGAATATANNLTISGGVTGTALNSGLTTLTLNGSRTASGTSSLAVMDSITGTIGDGSGGGKLAVIKDGTGSWALGGANTFSGGLTIKAGTVVLGTSSASGGAGVINLGDTASTGLGATLTLYNSGAVPVNALTVQAGSTGTKTIRGNGNSTATQYNGTITMNDNMTAYGGPSGSLTFGTGATINLNASTLTLSGGTLNCNGVIFGSGNVTQAVTGTSTLNAANTFTGVTKVTAGTLSLANSLALQNSLLDTANSIVGTSTAGLKTTVMTLTLGGLTGIKDLSSIFTTTAGGYSGSLTALTINPGTGVSNSYSGIIADGAAGMTLTKTGNGTQTLTGANTFSGGTTLNVGNLQIGVNSSGLVGAVTSGAVGTGTLTLNGGTLSSATTTGRTLLNAVTIGGNVTLGDATNTGTLIFSAGVDLGGNGRTLTTASNVNINGAVSNGSIIKDGSGILLLGGANTFNGLTISAGTVSINGPNVGSVGSITSTPIGAGTLTLNGGSISSATSTSRTILNAVNFTGNAGFGGDGNGALTFSANADLGTVNRTLTTVTATTLNGIVSNTGGINKAGASSLTLGGANTYTGNTTVTAGVLQLGNALALQNSTLDTTSSLLGDASNGLKITPTTLTLGGLSGNKDLASVFTTTSGGYTGLTALTLNSGNGSSKSYSGIIADGAAGMTLTKTGNGTQTLTGANTYSGGTLVSAGTLIGTSTSLQGAINNNSAVIFDQAANGSYGGSMSGTGTLTKANSGTLTLSGANTYSGGTLVSAGTLIGTSTSLQGAINNNSAVIFDQAANGSYGGSMGGTGTLTKANSGTLELTGSSSYSAGTTVSTGTLLVNNSTGSATGTGAVSVAAGAILGGSGSIAGATTISGILAPGNSIGTLTVANDVIWNGSLLSGATTNWKFELGAANTADLLRITGPASEFIKGSGGSGSVFCFDFMGSTETGTFTLVDWDSIASVGGGVAGTSFAATDFTYTNLGSSNTGTFQFNGSQLEFQSIPEPSTTTLSLFSAVLFGTHLAIRRRRRA